MMNRRAFLSWATGAAAGIAVGGCASDAVERAADPTALPAPSPVPTATPDPTSTPVPTSEPTPTPTPVPPPPMKPLLVVVHMAGGNDGLNTVIPTELGRYHDLRPQLSISAADALRFRGAEDLAGFHPALAPLEGLWNADQLACVHSVGIPSASRSHFVASDAWWSARTEPSKTGWVGRWLDTLPGSSPLTAISMDRGAELLTAQRRRSTLVSNVEQFDFLTPPGWDQEALLNAYLSMAVTPAKDPAIASIQQAILATADSTGLFGRVAATGPDSDDGVSSFTGLLEIAAALVIADPAIRVINVGITGFDTHATQERVQAELLADLATGIAGFFTTAEKHGFAERTVVMTTSEFGRRAAENGSTGTDHGKAGVQFVCGPAVASSQIMGLPDLASLDDGDVPIEFDVRSIYAEVLQWMGTDEPETILDRTWPSLNLLNPRA